MGFTLSKDYCYPLPSLSSPEISMKNLIKILLKLAVAFAVCMGFILALYATFWITLQPSPPEFGINSASIVLNLDSNRPGLSGSWAIEIEAHNPNYPGQVFDYTTLVAFVSYHSEFSLASAHVRPFSQPGNNWTLFQAHVVSPSQYLNDDFRGMIEEGMTRGDIEFNVDVAADYKYACPYLAYAPVNAVSCNRVKFQMEAHDMDVSSVNGTMVEVYPRKCLAVDQRPAAVKQMWFIVFLLSFVYLIIDVIL